MELVRHTWHFYLRHLRATRRMPIFIAIAVVQPVLWVVVFGQLFRAVTRIPGFGADSYVQFLAPGIAVMSAVFGAAHSGLGLLADIDRGILDRLLATPARRAAIVAARIVHAATMVMVQSLIILGVAALLGARPSGGATGVAVVLLCAGLLGCGFAAFSNALALLTRRQEIVIAIMNFTVLPMTFLSSMMMSSGLMPGWIRSVSRFNPVDWAVRAARGGFEGVLAGGVATPLALLVAFAAALGGVATAAFHRYRMQM